MFGRTDLRKGVSEATFDVEAAGDVKKCLAPAKTAENHEKNPKFVPKQFRKKIFDVEKSKDANRPKRVFPKFRADRSQVGGRTDVRSTNFYGRIRSNTFEYVQSI